MIIAGFALLIVGYAAAYSAISYLINKDKGISFIGALLNKGSTSSGASGSSATGNGTTKTASLTSTGSPTANAGTSMYANLVALFNGASNTTTPTTPPAKTSSGATPNGSGVTSL